MRFLSISNATFKASAEALYEISASFKSTTLDTRSGLRVKLALAGPPLLVARAVCSIPDFLASGIGWLLVTMFSAATFKRRVADCNPDNDVEIADVIFQAYVSSFKPG